MRGNSWSGTGIGGWPDRVIERVIIFPNGCWDLDVVPGTPGRFAANSRRVVRDPATGKQYVAYKMLWEWANGPVPEGLLLFCVCASGGHNCVNPDHWQPMSRREGMLMSRGWQDSCSHGHPRDQFTLRLPGGQLKCRACDSEARRRYRAAHPEKERAAYERMKAARRAKTRQRRGL